MWRKFRLSREECLLSHGWRYANTATCRHRDLVSYTDSYKFALLAHRVGSSRPFLLYDRPVRTPPFISVCEISFTQPEWLRGICPSPLFADDHIQASSTRRGAFSLSRACSLAVIQQPDLGQGNWLQTARKLSMPNTNRVKIPAMFEGTEVIKTPMQGRELVRR